ncbi:hypothetical protein ABZU76_02915 [Amycolatopsis sp. NPDC005232]|uniref:hypothetical protein n=1 Tax=Amycolatopsis sp. NPDC005232 TaxID=3157027 RepID=UPI0033A97D79
MNEFEWLSAEADDAARRIAGRLAQEQLDRFGPRGISDDTEEEFVQRITDTVFPLVRQQYYLSITQELNLFGFGKITQVLTRYDAATNALDRDGLIWSCDLADALGWNPADLAELCRREYLWETSEQWEIDRKNGAHDPKWTPKFTPMGVSVWHGPGSSDEHYGPDGMMRGPILKNWQDLYLIDTDRILMLMTHSPWAREFMTNAKPLLSHAFEQSGLADLFADVQTLRHSDGEMVETGESLADAFAEDRAGITEEEAARRAMRGPIADLEDPS